MEFYQGIYFSFDLPPLFFHLNFPSTFCSNKYLLVWCALFQTFFQTRWFQTVILYVMYPDTTLVHNLWMASIFKLSLYLHISNNSSSLIYCAFELHIYSDMETHEILVNNRFMFLNLIILSSNLGHKSFIRTKVC